MSCFEGKKQVPLFLQAACRGESRLYNLIIWVRERLLLVTLTDVSTTSNGSYHQSQETKLVPIKRYQPSLENCSVSSSAILYNACLNKTKNVFNTDCNSAGLVSVFVLKKEIFCNFIGCAEAIQQRML